MKKNLLSIGEMAKLSGVHIKSLRYYEKVGVLLPTHVDPSSGYRYYDYTSAYKIELIKLAVEMDVPLKELKEFLGNGDIINFKSFLEHTKKIAHKKMGVIKNGLNYVKFFEDAIERQNKCTIGEIYKYKLPQKFFYTIPYENEKEAEENFLKLPYEKGSLEYGYLLVHTKNTTNHYIFAEIPKKKANFVAKGGEYFFVQNYDLNIQETATIFAEYISEETEFLVISTEIFPGTIDINKQLNELRICIL
ncbi:MAG: MerR family DNA-binding transcriptional regulator [Defluviitaleaceae bacterium]|nr:MerR family DNA-binding transcriptional regulator [Defluviitaleaceae bacterium]